MIVSSALVARGSDSQSPQDEPRDGAADARDVKVPTRYCYEFGGPSDLEPDAGDAGLNPNVCGDGSTCVQVTGASNWFCFYAPPKN